MYKAVACTEIGVRKPSNQDSCCLLEAETSYGPAMLMAVCDGVGGLEHGEVASAIAVSCLEDWFEQQFPVFVRFNSEAGVVNLSGLRDVFTQLFLDMNEKVAKTALRREQRMATTCTCLLIMQGQAVVGHVGDSRALLIRNREVRRLTQDHSLVAREVLRGNITEEQAAHHPQRNVLLQAVGAQDGIEPFIDIVRVKADDCLLICCDGFHHEISDALISKTFADAACASESELRRRCQQLIRFAIDAGETDNITVVCSVLARQEHEATGYSGCEGADEETTLFDGPNDEETVLFDIPDDEATVLIEDETDAGVNEFPSSNFEAGATRSSLSGDDAPTCVLSECDDETVNLETSSPKNTQNGDE